MKLRPFTAGCVLALAASAANAEVKQAAADGMLLAYGERVSASPSAVYNAIGAIERWWSREHTYSGDAANLALRTEAGSCFCERWKDGSVEHGRVVLALRDRMLRIEGAFGPLQAKAARAMLTFALKPDGSATLLSVDYRVSGDSTSALDKDAAAVDGVLGEQVRRLVRYIEAGKATP